MSQQLERLEDYIKPKGLTISTLADELGVSRSTFTHIKRKNGQLSAKLLNLILKKFPDLDVNWLNGNAPSPYKKLNNEVNEPVRVYGAKSEQRRFEECALDKQFLDALTKQLDVKDAMISNLTRIIENLTTKST